MADRGRVTNAIAQSIFCSFANSYRICERLSHWVHMYGGCGYLLLTTLHFLACIVYYIKRIAWEGVSRWCQAQSKFCRRVVAYASRNSFPNTIFENKFVHLSTLIGSSFITLCHKRRCHLFSGTMISCLLVGGERERE